MSSNWLAELAQWRHLDRRLARSGKQRRTWAAQERGFETRRRGGRDADTSTCGSLDRRPTVVWFDWRQAIGSSTRSVIQNLLYEELLRIAATSEKSRDSPQKIIKEQRLSWKNWRVPIKESSISGEPLRYYRTTGLMVTQMQELARRVNAALDKPWNKRSGRPKSLGLYKAVEA